MKHKLAAIMKEKAYFEFYQNGKLHYVIHVPTLYTLTSYHFTIDLSDPSVREGKFNDVERGILLMRWFNNCVEDKSLIIEVHKSVMDDEGVSKD